MGSGLDYAGLRWRGEPIELTAMGYALFYDLSVQAPRVLIRCLLLQRVRGSERVGEGWLLRNVVKVL